MNKFIILQLLYILDPDPGGPGDLDGDPWRRQLVYNNCNIKKFMVLKLYENMLYSI